MSDYTDHAHAAYLERVRRTAQRLREAADRMEQAGTRVEDHGGVMPSYAGDPYVHAAQRAVHEVMWGLANSGLDLLVNDAGLADRAFRDEAQA